MLCVNEIIFDCRVLEYFNVSILWQKPSTTDTFPTLYEHLMVFHEVKKYLPRPIHLLSVFGNKCNDDGRLQWQVKFELLKTIIWN